MTCPICRRPEPECDCIRDAEGRPIAPAPKIDPVFERRKQRPEDDVQGDRPDEEVSDDKLHPAAFPDNPMAWFLHRLPAEEG